MSVRSRIIGAISALFTLCFLYLMIQVDNVIRPAYLMSIEDSLVDMATYLSSQLSLEADGLALKLDAFNEVVTRASKKDLKIQIYDLEKNRMDLRIYVTDQAGLLQYDSRRQDPPGTSYMGWPDVFKSLRGEYGARASWERSGKDRNLVLYVGAPVRTGDSIIGVVTVGKSTAYGYSSFLQARRHNFYGLLILLIFISLLGIAITIWITRPTRLLTDYAQKIGLGLPSVLPELGNTELGKLGTAFEKMRDTLEGKKYIEEYVQALTHEIKSPLSAIKGAAELLEEDMSRPQRKKFLENINRESQRIQRLVDRLLELSSIESRKKLQEKTDVDIRRLVKDNLTSMMPLIQAKQIELKLEDSMSLAFQGETFLLNLAVSNLIQNAVDFSTEGGTIRIYAREQALVIEDSGPGIPDFAMDRVFDRFFSWSPTGSTKKSSGLGLSIVKHIAHLHQGKIHLENVNPHGLRAIISVGEADLDANTGFFS